MPPGPPTPVDPALPPSSADTPSHIRGIASRLHAALRRALNRAVPAHGGTRRMSELRTSLNLDKTLASRLNRAANADDPLTALALGPGVPGYRLLVQRLESRAATDSARAELAALRQGVDDLEAAFALFPNGRRGFDAALAGWLAPAGASEAHAEAHTSRRARAERRARQQIYQATLFLMGVEIDVAYQAFLYKPADDPACCDLAYVEVRQDLRRVRPGTREILTGVPYIIPSPAPAGADASAREQIEDLRGEPIQRDAQAALLPEFCSSPLPRLTTIERTGSLLLVAPGDVPRPGDEHALTTAVGVIGRNIVPRWRDEHPGTGAARDPATHLQNSIVNRKPVRAMVVDVLIDDTLNLGAPTFTLSATSTGPAPRTPNDDDLAALPQCLAFSPLPACSAGQFGLLSDPEVRRVPALLARLVGAAYAPARHAHAPSPSSTNAAAPRFRAYRLRIDFPIPHARHLVWLELPASASEAPASPSENA